MKILGLSITRDKPTEKRDINDTVSPFILNDISFGLNSHRGTALSLSTVFCAVNLISDAIATLPIQIKSKHAGKKEVLEEHSLYGAFNSNNITKYSLIKAIIQSVLLKGNGYCHIERAGSKVTGLRYLPHEDVQVYYKKETKELYYSCSYIKDRIIQPSDMLHFVKHTFDGVNGVSVLTYASRSLNIANQTENAAETFFSSGCKPSGILKIHGNATTEQRKEALIAWTNSFRGGNQSSGVAVLPSNMDYQSISLNSSDAQMLETRQFGVTDIARFFNISPVLLGDLTKSSYSTIEATNIQFLSYTLTPYINMIEEELNKKLIGTGDNLHINLDETAILRTNKQETASYYNSLLSMGVLSINEVRKELGFNPVEGGDSHNLAYNDVSKTDITSNSNMP